MMSRLLSPRFPHDAREEDSAPPDATITRIGRRLFLRNALLVTVGCGALLRDGTAADAQTKVPKLKMTKLPDGSGVVGLPPGWKVSGSYAGTCVCNGPNGAQVLMGMPWVIQLPEFDMSEFPGEPTLPKAPVGNLEAALREVLTVEGKAKVIRIHSKPAAGPAGKPAATLVYEFVKNGKRHLGMGYFTMLDYLDGLPNWRLYSSAVIAPKERFVQDLPTMMAIYDSWRPDGKIPKEPKSKEMADAAAAALRAQGAATIKARQEAFDRMLEKWREVQ